MKSISSAKINLVGDNCPLESDFTVFYQFEESQYQSHELYRKPTVIVFGKQYAILREFACECGDVCNCFWTELELEFEGKFYSTTDTRLSECYEFATLLFTGKAKFHA